MSLKRHESGKYVYSIEYADCGDCLTITLRKEEILYVFQSVQTEHYHRGKLLVLGRDGDRRTIDIREAFSTMQDAFQSLSNVISQQLQIACMTLFQTQPCFLGGGSFILRAKFDINTGEIYVPYERQRK